ncbi:hypothetical protein SODALDRAFT_328450, partial [Sodiomyces alkalinus F11]
MAGKCLNAHSVISASGDGKFRVINQSKLSKLSSSHHRLPDDEDGKFERPSAAEVQRRGRKLLTSRQATTTSPTRRARECQGSQAGGGDRTKQRIRMAVVLGDKHGSPERS